MAKFHPLTINLLNKLTSDTVEVGFAVPDELKETFDYKHGQHLTLKADINGEDVRRSYSICSCPLHEGLSVAIKQVEGGRFSTFANEKLQIGDTLEVMPPTGHFGRPLDSNNEKLYVGFASGSGITPIASIIETTMLTEPKSKFILFYGNRETDSIIFRERLEALKNEHLGQLSLHHILSKERQDAEIFNGRIDEEKIRVFAKAYFHPLEVDEFFICGPEQMMISASETLQALGVEKDRVHMELFTSPVGKLGVEKKVEHEVYQSEITIIQDGNEFTFPYDSDKNILDAAFDKGADLPYACKGGVCSTCAAKLISGEVDMEVNYALEPDEVEAGLVLTCQSFPKSDKVKLSFDV